MSRLILIWPQGPDGPREIELSDRGVLVIGNDPERAGFVVEGPAVDGAHCAMAPTTYTSSRVSSSIAREARRRWASLTDVCLIVYSANTASTLSDGSGSPLAVFRISSSCCFGRSSRPSATRS